jgi:hypothetical protein
VRAEEWVELTIESYRYWTTPSQHHVTGLIRNTSPYRVNASATIGLAPSQNGASIYVVAQAVVLSLAPGQTSGFSITAGFYDGGTATPHLIEITAGGYVVEDGPIGAVGVSRSGPIESGTNMPATVPVTIRNRNPWRVWIESVAGTFYRADGQVAFATRTPVGLLVEPGADIVVNAVGEPTVSVASVDVSVNAWPQYGLGLTIVAWTNWFEDVGASSFKAEVAWMAESGITAGCAQNKYCPTATVTRGQMASFLARALDLPAAATDFFGDDNGTTHEANINRLAAAGITSGCAPGAFCPDDPVTREQMASFLARALALPATSTDYFTDDETSTHEANINRLAASGITSGCSATTYCPKANVTREQMAAFLYRGLR